MNSRGIRGIDLERAIKESGNGKVEMEDDETR
jgi:hypothetical protein